VNNTNPILSKKVTLVTGIILVVLILDQWLKIWVKTHMTYGEDFPIMGFDWAYIHFVENNGMAFGLSLGGDSGKLALSIFRLVAVGFLIYFISRLIKEQAKTGVLVSFALIMAGAMGNIIDSCFYGLIFSESNYHGGVAEAFPEGGGYAGFLFGKVVDMFYFPVIDTILPSWVPFWGGERFQFFKPVFNLADASISIGVFSLLLFQRSFFRKEPESTVPPIPETIEEDTTNVTQQEELNDESSETKA